MVNRFKKESRIGLSELIHGSLTGSTNYLTMSKPHHTNSYYRELFQLQSGLQIDLNVSNLNFGTVAVRLNESVRDGDDGGWI